MKYVLFIAIITNCQINFFAQSDDGLIIPTFQQVPERAILYPLKDKKMIYPDSLVDIAINNIAQYSSARAVRDRILKRADYWLDFTDEELSRLITSAAVPRAFDLSTTGCPVHGDSIFQIRGAYPWIIDPKHPLQVKCPVGGETYPSNNFVTYYSSGFKDKVEWDTEYVDDGWGWVSPSGERYWFVAHANQWLWNRQILPGISVLSQAYILTGDQQYASKAINMLYRVASAYPSMDYENQSRYGLMMRQQGKRYPGKILNRIWETNTIINLAEAYDMVWDQIDRELMLQQRLGKSGEDIRAFIEANLLEEGLEAIEEQKILGNFGMHQNAFVTLHLSRQHAGTDEAMHQLLNEPSSSIATTGLRYALYNQVMRDGMPYESPQYNTIWISHLTKIAEKLSKMNIDLFSESRLKRLIDTPLKMVATELYTPDLGDGGSVLGGVIGKNPDIYHIAYNHYGEDKYLQWINRSKEQSFSSFASLFRKPLVSIPKLPGGKVVAPAPSRIFAGYGLGILNNPSDQTAVSLTYGMHVSHFHWDFLNIEIFANGQKMMPDLGYPDAMNVFVPGIYTWSRNTISHNTVVIDEKRQQRNLPGALYNFADGSFARVINASSPAYEDAQIYRRNITMVDTDNEQSYFIDFFHVHGGYCHNYSLHGPPGEVISRNGSWSDILPGTFAGPTVEIGKIYDDVKLQNDGHKTGYAAYQGSGYQHLFNVQKLKSGNGMVEYRHSRDKNARLRLLLLPDTDQDVFLADAYDKPRGKEHLLKYLIARRKSNNDIPLESTFISLIAPHKGEDSLFKSAQLIQLDRGKGHVVEVNRDLLTDVVIHDPTGSQKFLLKYDIHTDATDVVATFKNNKLIRLFFSEGSYFRSNGQQFKSEEIRGKVISVDAKNNTFQVELNKTIESPINDLFGRIAFFTNSYRTTAHPIENVELINGSLKIRTSDDLLTGHLRIDDIVEDQLKSNTSLTFTKDYAGATLLDSDFREVSTLEGVYGGTLSTNHRTAVDAMSVGDEAWISNIGIGDEFVIKSVFSWDHQQ